MHFFIKCIKIFLQCLSYEFVLLSCVLAFQTVVWSFLQIGVFIVFHSLCCEENRYKLVASMLVTGTLVNYEPGLTPESRASSTPKFLSKWSSSGWVFVPTLETALRYCPVAAFKNAKTWVIFTLKFPHLALHRRTWCWKRLNVQRSGLIFRRSPWILLSSQFSEEAVAMTFSLIS